MCLVVIAWRAHQRYPLVIAGNRDEYHARPSSPAGWWADLPEVFGGRDLTGGGSWLAVSRQGRFAVVTNHPGRPGGPERTQSRGHLVRDWVSGYGDLPQGFLHRVGQREAEYGGFCLVVGDVRFDPEGLIVPTGPAGPRWRLPEGITGLANGPRERPPVKALWLEREYQRLLGDEDPDPEALLAPLSVRTPVNPVAAGADWRERARVTPFIVDDTWGTRASTLVLFRADGHVRVIERSYGPAGRPAGTVDEEFPLAVPVVAASTTGT